MARGGLSQVGGSPLDRLGGQVPRTVPQPGSGRAGPAPTVDQGLLEAARQRPQGPQYFGFHTDASILARMAQQGIAPNAINLRIAQQLLRYGIPLSSGTLSHVRQLWQALGAMSLVDLEALIALFSIGVGITPENLKSMLQLLAGGPMSHHLARLTLALKKAQGGVTAGENFGLEPLRGLLQQYWKLGNGAEALPAELAKFQFLQSKIRMQVESSGIARQGGDLALEIASLQQLFRAQDLLLSQRQSGSSVYIPFFQWREQQPLPGEFLMQADRETAAKQQAAYTQISIAVDTRNLGRMTIDLTACRNHLGVQFEVQDQAIRHIVEGRLQTLRNRLTSGTRFVVAGLSAIEVGQGRSISALLPKRRDLRKLGRAIGIL